MATRAIIAKVGRQGDGLAVHLEHDGSADAAGATLLQHYLDEASVDRLIRKGSIVPLEPAPEGSTVFVRDYGQTWEIRLPHAFSGGTEGFFARYWGVGPQWLYAWTPDGWLASPAMPGAPPESYHADWEALWDADPLWREWLRRTREFQRPQPLHSLIRDHRAR